MAATGKKRDISSGSRGSKKCKKSCFSGPGGSKIVKNGGFLGGVIFPKKRVENAGRADLDFSRFLGRKHPFFWPKSEHF